MWCIGVSRNVLAVVFVVVALALAGCSGKSKTKGEEFQSAPPAGYNEDTCGIEGIVIDDEIAAISGADVGVLGPQGTVNETKTAADGTFSFSFVTAGPYQLVASKAGFNAKPPMPIACVGGESLTGQEIQLIRIPDPQASFHETIGPLSGRIACGAGVGSFATGENLDPCKAAGQESKYRFEFHVKPFEVTGAVYESVWTRSSGSGGEFLALMYPSAREKAPVQETTTGKLAPQGGRTQGRSPLSVTMVTQDPSQGLFTNEDKARFVEVRPASNPQFPNQAESDETSKLVIDQKFDVYITLFYLGDPIPAGFTALPTV